MLGGVVELLLFYEALTARLGFVLGGDIELLLIYEALTARLGFVLGGGLVYTVPYALELYHVHLNCTVCNVHFNCTVGTVHSYQQNLIGWYGLGPPPS